MTQIAETHRESSKLVAAQLAVERIAQDCLDRTAYRAALRRNQGWPLDEARDVPWFRHLLAQVRREVQAKEIKSLPSDGVIFLVATLLADDARALDLLARGQELNGVPRDLGASLSLMECAQDRDAYDKKMSVQPVANRRESRFERRLRMLLDAGLTSDGTGELPFRLRQALRMILSQRDGQLHVQWAQLLHDLHRWNWENRPAQRDWARSFYGDPRASDATDAPAPNATDLTQ